MASRLSSAHFATLTINEFGGQLSTDLGTLDGEARSGREIVLRTKNSIAAAIKKGEADALIVRRRCGSWEARCLFINDYSEFGGQANARSRMCW